MCDSLPNYCGRPGYARIHPSGGTLGRLSIRPLTAILWISLILFSCSSFENCCKDAYIISAIFRAAFFCLASLLSVFIFQMLAMQVKPVLAALHIAYQLS